MRIKKRGKQYGSLGTTGGGMGRARRWVSHRRHAFHSNSNRPKSLSDSISSSRFGREFPTLPLQLFRLNALAGFDKFLFTFFGEVSGDGGEEAHQGVRAAEA